MYRFLRCVLINKNVPASNRISTCVVYRDNLEKPGLAKPSCQSVVDFYTGRSVFITGATGFVGRVLIERLLSTCKDIEKVYILIRKKENASVQQRVQHLLRNPIFANLKKTRPHDLNKIVPIAGDVSDVTLGINLDDEQILTEKVSVIFHTAANVKFRAPLTELMKVNFEGTEKVMELGRKIKKLDMFVHVSTAFNISKNTVVDEIVYSPPRNIEDVDKIISNYKTGSKEIREMIGDWGNSYLFSKKMAEGYVASNHGSIPTVIVRPSMVTSVYKEPLIGYTDSWVAGTVLLCDIASGLTRVVYGSKDVAVEIIPVDYVCNFLIVSAALNARCKNCNVYNLSTGHSNPIQWRKLSDIYIKEGKKHGYGIMPVPKVYFTKVKWMMPMLIYLMQILPAFAADTWLRVSGKQPRYMKMQKTAISRAVFSQPATISSWDIKTGRTRDLISTLNGRDREIFPCDPVTIHWDKYVPIYCKGVKDYMLGKNKK